MKTLMRLLRFSFVALAVIGMVGCGVSKEDHDKTVSELSKTKADLAQAQTKIADLEKALSEAQAQQKALSDALAQQKAASEAQAQAKSQPKEPAPAEKPAAAQKEAAGPPAGESQALVDAALKTFQGFMRDKNYEYLHNNLKNANGLLIYPRVLKAGFILGGSGGTGVLVVRDANTGDWSQPAFYTIGSVSFGLQIGGEAAEVIVMVRTQKALDSLFTTSVKFGGDTSVAAGPYGVGAKANVTTAFVSFAKSKGLYAGLNLEGSAVDVREGLNKAYYGQEVTPVQIIVEKKVSNKGSAGLREALKKAAK
jgi:lipid-binding SYLF domain-containing protein